MSQSGQIGEELAVNYLKKHNYLIIKRNVKISYYELDIIARHQDSLVFVEVKTKSSENKLWEPENLINHKKMLDFKKAAQLYCAKNKLELAKASFEIIAIDLNGAVRPEIRHYRDII